MAIYTLLTFWECFKLTRGDDLLVLGSEENIGSKKAFKR
jgi:hypothetical protein